MEMRTLHVSRARSIREQIADVDSTNRQVLGQRLARRALAAMSDEWARQGTALLARGALRRAATERSRESWELAEEYVAVPAEHPHHAAMAADMRRYATEMYMTAGRSVIGVVASCSCGRVYTEATFCRLERWASEHRVRWCACGRHIRAAMRRAP